MRVASFSCIAFSLLRLCTRDRISVPLKKKIMIPAGYMAKTVSNRPDWLEENIVKDIYSLSGCISSDFADYINDWKHNGFWLFDSPQIIKQLAGEKGIDLKEITFFYYEVYEKQFDEDGNEDALVTAELPFETNVEIPAKKNLEGFDVVNFFAGSSPECSPLSCNGLAKELKVNRHCLFDLLEDAITHLKNGDFKNSEPGPYRIFSVYSL